MHELVAVMSITILAVISPGPDFAMVMRNSYAFGRGTGLVCALGIAAGVQVHVFYTVLGIAVLIMQSPYWFAAMKTLGALYLMYLGYRSLRNQTVVQLEVVTAAKPSLWQAFGMGFLTNALNPKTMLFVVATFTQLVDQQAPLWLNFTYGFFMSLAHWVWFSVVALLVSKPALRTVLVGHQFLLDKLIGLALILLGGSLLFTKAVGV